MIFIKLITIFIITMTSPRVFKRIPCLGDNWTGFGQTNFKSEWYLSSPQKKGFRAKAIVPGNVRQTLMKEGIIKDPFVGLNNKDSLWVSTIRWKYSTKINLVNILRNSQKKSKFHEENGIFHLIFQGVDYDADFKIDGNAVCRQKGMFSPVDIASSFKGLKKLTGNNEKSIALDVEFHVQPFWRTHAVKCQMAFGWDFAPEIRTIGIWKPITVHLTGPAFFTELIAKIPQNEKYFAHSSTSTTAPIEITGNISIFDINRETLKEVKKPRQITFEISWGDHQKYSQQITRTITSGEEFKLKLQESEVKIWNTWSMGKPSRVPITIKAKIDGQLTDIYNGNVINRHVKWVKNPGSLKSSEDWTFCINGKRMFLRGFNWVPPDSLFARITKNKYEKLVDAALDMNVDMLRVWGGGIEEKPSFYEYCDKKGMLIWQEYPFACTNYPKKQSYLDIVKKECDGITLRTRQYPSVVVYCGGNEYNPFINQPIIDILEHSVQSYAPDRHFFLASPFRGDDHNWRYWGLRKGLEAYEVNGIGPFQFLSEYGMQAAPNRETLDVIMGDSCEDGYIANKDRFDHHRADLDGLEYYAKKHEKPIEDISSFISTTQDIQAISLKYAVEVCRSAWPNVSGVFPWQLSDPWPNISWSVLDYYLRKKKSFEVMRIAYCPVLPMVRSWKEFQNEDRENRVWRKGNLIIHNATQSQFNGKLSYHVLSKGNSDKPSYRLLKKNSLELSVASDRPLKVGTIDVPDKDGVVIRMSVRNTGGKLMGYNFCFPHMHPRKFKAQKALDTVNTKFDRWWRNHMTKLMEMERVKEHHIEWDKRKRKFWKNRKEAISWTNKKK